MNNFQKKIMFSLVMILLCSLFYKMFLNQNIEKKAYEYLETKGCTKSHIKTIKIKQSFINRLLSYDEWNIEVNIYNKYQYIFTYKNKEIVLRGLNDEGKLSKEEYQDLLEEFESGKSCVKEELIGENL